MNDLKPVANAWPVTQIGRINRDRGKFKDPRDKQQERTEKREENEDEKKIDEYA